MNNTEKKTNNKKKLVIICMIILILLIIGIVLFIIYDKKIDEKYKNIEEDLENSAYNYLAIKSVDFEKLDEASIIISDVQNIDALNNKSFDKCDGYVIFNNKLNKKTNEYELNDKAYISCGIYKTKGYNAKYAKESNIKMMKTSKEENSSSNDSLSDLDYKDISTIEEDSINKQLHDKNFMEMIYYTLGACVNNTDTIDGNKICEESMDKSKLYLYDTNDRMIFVANYYLNSADNENEKMQSCFTVDKFNNLMNNTFGVKLTTNELSNYMSDNYVCVNEYNGMGSVTYTFTASDEPTYDNGIYTLPIDLINPKKVDSSKIYKSGYNLIVPKNNYNEEAIYTTMYLKYKKLSDGSKVIVSLGFNK